MDVDVQEDRPMPMDLELRDILFALVKNVKYYNSPSPNLLLRANISHHGYRSQETRECGGLRCPCYSHWFIRQLWRCALRASF